MDLTQLANLGEFIGGVAVIGSLIYVGIQVRAQAKESRLESLHSLYLAYGTFLDSLIGSQEVREVYLQGLESFESLNGEQRLLFSACMMKLFRFHQSAFHQWRAGRIEQVTWKTFNQPAADLLSYPGLQTWWASRSGWFSDGFQEHIRLMIDRSVGAPPYLAE